MADSTTPLFTLSASQNNQEARINELFDAASPATYFGRNADTSTGLTWGYFAAKVLSALLSWAKNRGLICTNVLIGHATLYQSNRAEITWTDEDVARFAAAAPSPEVGFIVRPG